MCRWIIAFSFVLLVTCCSDPSGTSPGKSNFAINKNKQEPRSVKKIEELPKSDQKGIKKNKKKRSHVISAEKPSDLKRIPDTAILSRIKFLRSLDEEIDLSEPVSREYLNGDLENRGEKSFTLISHEKFLKINFDNDILDNTDHFYTNGIRLEIIAPAFRFSPLNILMVPYWRPAINYYGIAVIQNMYTPSTTKTGGILYGDRPYAAYLCFNTFKISNDPVRKFRQTTELLIGIIGPSSGGGMVQSTFHKVVPTNNEPLGWQFQIQNDLVLNYNLSYEKGILERHNADINLICDASLGTLNTGMTGGFSLRMGRLNPVFSRLSVTPGIVNETLKENNLQIYFFMKARGVVVGYDATLQGGLINKTSVYTIPSDHVSRLMLNSSAGLVFSYGGIRLDLEQFLISPEFRYGWWHKWVHIGLTFCL